MGAKGSAGGLMVGWAETDITPSTPVYLAGQMRARVSEGVMDPITSTVMVIESADSAGQNGFAAMVSCDLVYIPDDFRDKVRVQVAEKVQGLRPENVFLSATHTHAAPIISKARAVCQLAAPPGMEAEKNTEVSHPYGIKLDAASPEEYSDFAAGRISDAVGEAWEGRKPSGFGYGLGHAVAGHNRLLAYRDGTSVMYGKADTPDFSHVEGYEDHSLYIMTTYDENHKLSGLVVNIPCTAQVKGVGRGTMSSHEITADYWHETRRELRKRYGSGLYILAQCAPAGDQSPTVLVNRRAEERMWRLKGRPEGQNAPREELAERIADGLEDALSCAAREIQWNPRMSHKREIIELPRRKISREEASAALKEAEEMRRQFEKASREIAENPELRREPRWYGPLTGAYVAMSRNERVAERFELQQKSPFVPVEVHVLALGEIAFATNPFELYLDYGIQIRERSRATQTFLVQLAGDLGYLPTERSARRGAYGTAQYSGCVGPEGGRILVDRTVEAINGMMED